MKLSEKKILIYVTAYKLDSPLLITKLNIVVPLTLKSQSKRGFTLSHAYFRSRFPSRRPTKGTRPATRSVDGFLLFQRNAPIDRKRERTKYEIREEVGQ